MFRGYFARREERASSINRPISCRSWLYSSRGSSFLTRSSSSFDERGVTFSQDYYESSGDGLSIYATTFVDDANPAKPPSRCVDKIFAKYGLYEARQEKYGKGGGSKGRGPLRSNKKSNQSSVTIKIPDKLKGKIPLADTLNTKPKYTFEKEKTTRSSSEIDDEMTLLQEQLALARKKRELDAAVTAAKSAKKVKKILPMPPPAL